MRSSEWLEAAADFIEERGWVRDKYMARDGRVCLMSALWGVAEDLRAKTDVRLDSHRAAMFVVDELGIELEEPSDRDQSASTRLNQRVRLQQALIDWNDEEAKDATHVIDVLRWSAKRAREGGDPECRRSTTSDA
jgi:hypothetical protein